MSPETTTRRPYRKRRRADAEAHTRLRIIEAAVALHGSIGPARTTIKAVAERAGVQRATVYRHFADEAALFDSCSAHWYATHPPPDSAEWAAISDPGERLERALGDLYAWYASDVRMFANTFRDAPLVPAMSGPVDRRQEAFEATLAILLRGRPERGRRRLRVRAAIAHAASFPAWHSLAITGGLGADDAVRVMLGAVEAASRP